MKYGVGEGKQLANESHQIALFSKTKAMEEMNITEDDIRNGRVTKEQSNRLHARWDQIGDMIARSQHPNDPEKAKDIAEMSGLLHGYDKRHVDDVIALKNLEHGMQKNESNTGSNAQAEQQLKSGERAAYGGNNYEAVQWFQKAAENGNVEAQYKLGVMLDKGLGVRMDSQQAMYWFRQGASQGHIGAMNNIGLMYEEGRGVRQDYREAINWYSKAAEHGNSMAHYNLGVVYEDGKGVPKDIDLAIEHFRMAANLGGVPEAQRMLNRILRGRNH